MNKNIGLYFGTFNPIHIGHMAIANYIVEYSNLDQVWFVVTPRSPFKKNSVLLDNYQRLELVNIAIGIDKRFKASNIEFNLPQPSYTINTLVNLEEHYENKVFTLIMGADNLLHLHKWKNFEIIINKYKILVYPRPGISKDNCNSYKNVSWVNAPHIEISSSFIRKSISENKDVRHFLPLNVWKYIDEMNFYK